MFTLGRDILIQAAEANKAQPSFLKYNHNHDKLGLFSRSNGSGSHPSESDKSGENRPSESDKGASNTGTSHADSTKPDKPRSDNTDSPGPARDTGSDNEANRAGSTDNPQKTHGKPLTSEISFELAPGEGSPMLAKALGDWNRFSVEEQHKLTKQVVDPLLPTIEAAGRKRGLDLKIERPTYGSGAWMDSVNPASVVAVHGDADAALWAMDRIGAALEQTGMFGHRLDPKGEAQFVDIRLPDHAEPLDLATTRKFWAKALELDKASKNPVGLDQLGASPLLVPGSDGQKPIPTLRIINGEGSWTPEHIKALTAKNGILHQAEQSLGLRALHYSGRAATLWRDNDWTKQRAGENYRSGPGYTDRGLGSRSGGIPSGRSDLYESALDAQLRKEVASRARFAVKQALAARKAASAQGKQPSFLKPASTKALAADRRRPSFLKFNPNHDDLGRFAHAQQSAAPKTAQAANLAAITKYLGQDVNSITSAKQGAMNAHEQDIWEQFLNNLSNLQMNYNYTSGAEQQKFVDRFLASYSLATKLGLLSVQDFSTPIGDDAYYKGLLEEGHLDPSAFNIPPNKMDGEQFDIWAEIKDVASAISYLDPKSYDYDTLFMKFKKLVKQGVDKGIINGPPAQAAAPNADLPTGYEDPEAKYNLGNYYITGAGQEPFVSKMQDYGETILDKDFAKFFTPAEQDTIKQQFLDAVNEGIAAGVIHYSPKAAAPAAPDLAAQAKLLADGFSSSAVALPWGALSDSDKNAVSAFQDAQNDYWANPSDPATWQALIDAYITARKMGIFTPKFSSILPATDVLASNAGTIPLGVIPGSGDILRSSYIPPTDANVQEAINNGTLPHYEDYQNKKLSEIDNVLVEETKTDPEIADIVADYGKGDLYQNATFAKRVAARRISNRLKDNPAWQALADHVAKLKDFQNGNIPYDQFQKNEPLDKEITFFPGASPSEVAASAMIHQWAASAFDTNPLSIAIQRAASRVFNTHAPASTDNYTQGQADTISKAYGPALQAFVKAQYDVTQDLLKKTGIKKVLLFRGIGLADNGLNTTSTLHKVDKSHKFYDARYMSDNDGPPLASWSTNPGTAMGSFGASMQGGAFAAGFIPAKDIVSTPYSGNGCLAEYEMVLKPGKAPCLIHVRPRKSGQDSLQPENTWNGLTGRGTPIVTMTPKKLKPLAAPKFIKPAAVAAPAKPKMALDLHHASDFDVVTTPTIAKTNMTKQQLAAWDYVEAVGQMYKKDPSAVNKGSYDHAYNDAFSKGVVPAVGELADLAKASAPTAVASTEPTYIQIAKPKDIGTGSYWAEYLYYKNWVEHPTAGEDLEYPKSWMHKNAEGLVKEGVLKKVEPAPTAAAPASIPGPKIPIADVAKIDPKAKIPWMLTGNGTLATEHLAVYHPLQAAVFDATTYPSDKTKLEFIQKYKQAIDAGAIDIQELKKQLQPKPASVAVPPYTEPLHLLVHPDEMTGAQTHFYEQLKDAHKQAGAYPSKGNEQMYQHWYKQGVDLGIVAPATPKAVAAPPALYIPPPTESTYPTKKYSELSSEGQAAWDNLVEMKLQAVNYPKPENIANYEAAYTFAHKFGMFS